MSETFNRIRTAIQSEHCSYKSTKKWLSFLPTRGTHVIQGPGENAGILDIGNGYALALRIESHNHPSFVNPYEGAATGVGGILRDIFTMGARPIALLDFLRFANNDKGKELLPEVVRGISDYGNTVGIPTVGGDILLHPSYAHNCLVNVCALGLVSRDDIIYGHALDAGLDLIYVGARTGRDGIGGSEMASAVLENVDVSSIQQSDPFLEKLLMEACCQLAEANLVHGMQDMGAAGLLCSTSEVVHRGRQRSGKNLGCVVDTTLIPLKDYSMTAADILLSETQERMLIVAYPEDTRNILAIFNKWDLEAIKIGYTTEDGFYSVLSRSEDPFRLPMTDLFPDLEEEWERSVPAGATKLEKPHRDIIQMIWRQYDWMVGARTVKGPNSPGTYAILDIPEVERELVVAWGRNLEYTSSHMHIEQLMISATRTMKALGAEPIGLTNCLNFGHPKDSMTDFVLTVDNLAELCRNLKIPIISGNVSLYNCSDTHNILPTPIIVMVGLRDKQKGRKK